MATTGENGQQLGRRAWRRAGENENNENANRVNWSAIPPSVPTTVVDCATVTSACVLPQDFQQRFQPPRRIRCLCNINNHPYNSIIVNHNRMNFPRMTMTTREKRTIIPNIAFHRAGEWLQFQRWLCYMLLTDQQMANQKSSSGALLFSEKS